MQGHRDLDRYLRKEIHGVAGYLATIDAEAIAALGKFQSPQSLPPDLSKSWPNLSPNPRAANAT